MALIESSYLVFTLLMTIGMQLSFFAIAYTLQIDKVTDFAGTMNFLAIAWVVWLTEQTSPNSLSSLRQIVVLVLLHVWAARLAFFLVRRVLARGHDQRFDEMRHRFFAFLGFWVFQMVWVWVVSLPVTLVLAVPSEIMPPLGVRDYVAYGIWSVGFLIETWADESRWSWSRSGESSKLPPLTTGIWSWSRHPNYFGEILMWTGMYITASGAWDVSGWKYAYFSVVSPLFTAFLLLFVSGIPMAEDRSDGRWGRKPLYRQYKAQTSPLIPCPPAVYKHLHPLLQRMFCCEFGMYSRHLPPASETDGAGVR